MKILFYGFRHGHINALYRKVAASPLFEIAGCVEPNEAARAAAETNLGARFSEKSYAEWLRTDIDAVAIGCAYGERGRAVIAAMEAGKHVIADKPVCTSLDELNAIRALTERMDTKLACMLDLRYLPQTLRAKEMLENARLGGVRNVAFNGQHCIDYARRPAWYFEEGMHGGTVNDLAIHGIDLVRMLTLQDICRIDAARTWNAYATRHPAFNDCAVFMARLENGASVLADVSYSAPTQVFSMPTYWEFRIWCERGLLTFNFVDPTVTVFEEGKPQPQIFSGIAPDGDYLTEFADEITQNTKHVTANVLRSTETALTIQQFADLQS